MSEQQEPRWYCVAKDGQAMLCADKEDAEHEAKDGDEAWPRLAPHRAVQLVDAAEVERLQAEIDALKLQRDELLEALKLIVEWDAYGFHLTDSHIEQAQKAIAKVEGGGACATQQKN